MKKKILIALGVVTLLLVVGVIILVSMDWGQYESTLVKSEIVNTQSDSTAGEELTPSFEKLYGVYEVDAQTSDNAEVLFEVDGLKNTKGGFDNFQVTLEVLESVESAELSVLIDAKTINTGNTMRDEHLLEEDFFHVEKYPEITYVATDITWNEGVYTANGELTLLETTKALSFEFDHLGGGTNQDGLEFEAFEGSFVFNRIEYGMEEDASVGDEVTMSFYLELVKS